MDYNQKTIQAYEDTAKEYAQKKAGKLTDSIPFLIKFAQLLKGKDVLEIGFGLGQDADWFIQNDFNYTGVDPVKSFANNLKTKFPNSNILAEDIRQSKFPANSFDGIYAMASLLHFNDLDLTSLINKVHMWLKKDGIFFATIKEGNSEEIRKEGRYFNYLTKERFLEITNRYFTLIDFSTSSPREYNAGKQNWLNFYFRKNVLD